MNKREKGFTLIELLSIIIVLGLILAIAIPSVRKAINKSYQESYYTSLENIKDTAKAYILSNNIDIQDGGQRIVAIRSMIEESLLNPILDPKSKEECDGYVRVSRTQKKYTFTPYLNCGSNYISEDYGYTDITPPDIHIIGDNPIDISVGESYSDAGATALDDIDGVVTSAIQTTNNVNNSVAGTYSVTYTVSDSASNVSTSTRTVNVIE